MTGLEQRMRDGDAVFGVVGLGYVGLPLAVEMAKAGHRVIGMEVSADKVSTINAGESHVPDVPAGEIATLVASGLLEATTDFARASECDAIAICVPTPLGKFGDPDMSFIMSATEQLAKYVHKGMVIVLESTTYPGTTRELLLPRLTGESGLQVGEDVFICFSPERVDPGRKDWTTLNTPKVIGGITPACAEVATAWYSGAIKTVVPVSSAEAAEMAKLLENTFRMINIGLVNELAIMCERLGVDVWEVIEAAATKPFGFMKFTPGPGLGGHCIPIDPLYLSWKMKELNYTARFIELASEINTNMPRYVVSRVMEALNDRGLPLKGSKVLVLGAAYKPDIDDLRESPSLTIIELLQREGAEVRYNDPYFPFIGRGRKYDLQMKCASLDNLSQYDCVLIVTDHSDYDYERIVRESQLVVDTRHATNGISSPKIVHC